MQCSCAKPNHMLWVCFGRPAIGQHTYLCPLFVHTFLLGTDHGVVDIVCAVTHNCLIRSKQVCTSTSIYEQISAVGSCS